MTDLQHKPKGWNEPLNCMTDEEWKEYFHLRQVLDVEMSEDEQRDLLDKIDLALVNEDYDLVDALASKLPLEAHYAYGLKLGLGLRYLKNHNLSEAKKAYPDEF